MTNSKYSHLLSLGEQAQTRIAAGEPASNLVSLLPGNMLSVGVAWTYPHAKSVFSLDEAATWTTDRVTEFEETDRQDVEAMASYKRAQEAAILKASIERTRRAAMTPVEHMVEDALICSPQFRAFAARERM